MLRLMSNNVWKCDKNDPRWEAKGESCAADVRARGFARVYEELRPDMIGMQEMSGTMTRELLIDLEERGLHYAVLWGSDTPIFYRADKLEVVDSFFYLYPEAVPGLEGSFNNSKTKSAAAGVFREKATGKIFAFSSTHLWWKSSDPKSKNYQAGSDEARQHQVSLISAKLNAFHAQYDCPEILVGDFNTNYNSLAVKQLMAEGFVHAHDVAVEYASEENGYHWCGADGYVPYVPKPFHTAIDHIFVRNAPEGAVRRFDRYCPEYYLPLSDHFPAYIDIEIEA